MHERQRLVRRAATSFQSGRSSHAFHPCVRRDPQRRNKSLPDQRFRISVFSVCFHSSLVTHYFFSNDLNRSNFFPSSLSSSSQPLTPSVAKVTIFLASAAGIPAITSLRCVKLSAALFTGSVTWLFGYCGARTFLINAIVRSITCAAFGSP